MFLLVCALLCFAGDDAGDGAVIIKLGGETVSAESGASATPRPPLPKISLDLEDADIHSVIRMIADVSGRNFIVSDGVQGKVTARLDDVPWDQALQAILWSQGLAAQDLGAVMLVGP
jgi:type IV pilus assembly protein PilQ